MADLPDVFVAVRPPTFADMKRIVAQGKTMAGDRFVPAMLRREEAVQAPRLARGAGPAAPANRRRAAVRAGGRAGYVFPADRRPHAAAVMARLASPTAQRSLVDLASVGAQPIGVRQQAAAAFRASVRQFGLRLSPSEIVRQYERYNQSAQQDKPTQQVLSGLLDTMEQAAKQGAGGGAKSGGQGLREPAVSDSCFVTPRNRDKTGHCGSRLLPLAEAGSDCYGAWAETPRGMKWNFGSRSIDACAVPRPASAGMSAACCLLPPSPCLQPPCLPSVLPTPTPTVRRSKG